jgi:putative membrane protein
MNYDYQMMNGYGWAGGMIVFWLVVLAVGAIVLSRLLKTRDHRIEPSGDPLGIIKLRYAKGEITKIEFEQLKKDIA